MTGRFKQPFLKLEKQVRRGARNEEQGLWEFVATGAAAGLRIWVTDTALAELVRLPADALTRDILEHNIDRIEQLVANAEMHGWPEQMGVYRDE
jgi:hypothetical protein